MSIDCSVSRVQFTPDLLPGDITGMSIYNRQTEEFEFRPGPVFANVVIADEINRASPKTQSALLECMAERQVTVDGVTYALASPFIVVATQNPIEMDGTYPLPEAQRDRFTARVSVGYPDLAAELTMLDEHAAADPLERCARSPTPATVQAAIETVRRVHGSAPRCGSTASTSSPRRGGCPSCGWAPHPGRPCSWCARLAPRPRCSGRGFVVPDDVRAVAVPVLAHRLLLAPDAQAARRSTAELVHGLLRACRCRRRPGPERPCPAPNPTTPAGRRR